MFTALSVPQVKYYPEAMTVIPPPPPPMSLWPSFRPPSHAYEPHAPDIHKISSSMEFEELNVILNARSTQQTTARRHSTLHF